MNNRELLIWLNAIPGMGGVRSRALLDHCGSPEAVLKAGPDQLTRVKGIGPAVAASIRALEPAPFLEQELAAADTAGIRIVTVAEEEYPASLQTIHDPPQVLYLKGDILPRDITAVGIVGSRRCSAYGAAQAERMGRELARAGVTVVSGCAVGIDTAAHKGALSGGGRTIGVIGSGLLKPYPRDNFDLMKTIAGQGGLVSEFHLNQGVERGNFVRRNWVISGLSLGVVVVEAAKRSGALITARYALEQGRDVFAIPGSVASPRTKGVHRLIRDGAILVEHARHVLEELGEIGSALAPDGSAAAAAKPAPSLDSSETTVLSSIEEEPVNIESIIQTSGLPAGSVAGILTMLEMKNMVKELPGKKYVRI